ncbi:hypothetical protein BD309DRAFT_896175, partial [Dichomitus squalens]
MWLKEFLNYGPKRPSWAFFADDILRRRVPATCKARDAALRVSPFLQTWTPSARALPPAVKALVATAAKFDVRLDGLAIAREIQREIPMWFHPHVDLDLMAKHASNTTRETRCLKSYHKLVTVGDFDSLAACEAAGNHVRNNNCRCDTCESQRAQTGCRHPQNCFAKAKLLLDLLPPKWDPRAPQPEDHEEAPETEEEEDNVVLFDPRVTVSGTVADAFRIFTGPSPVHPSTPDTRINKGEAHLTVATDGSCMNNGERNASAGAGVFVLENHPANISIRLPSNLEQSNQTGELVGTLMA